MTDGLKHIAVDLTSILPGGENGGAKIFVLELLIKLAEKRPRTKFTLLTNMASHADLLFMERHNMVRLLILGQPSSTSRLRDRISAIAKKIFAFMPKILRRMLSKIVFKLHYWLKRNASSTLLSDMQVNLLFCPFTATTYSEPGIPVVSTIYDLQYKTYPGFFDSANLSYRNYVFENACKRATKLAAISEYSRQTALLHSSLPSDAIKTIYLRMSQRITASLPQEHKILTSFELQSNQYIFYPANFWLHKNHEMLLTAFNLMRHEYKDSSIKLVFTGHPCSRQPWLESAVKQMGLADFVVFAGYLTANDLSGLMKNARAVIFPSLYEGFGLPVIEAMAAGIPVACSDTTSLPEVVGDAALLFNPAIPTEIAQSMYKILYDQELREKLSNAGRKRAEFFSDIHRMEQEYWELFLQACQA